ncbi:uncharacterized protein ASPGLDRAFT_51809 [Aspergillus glaucus CBS 516.65]|uniref:Uncharacterized protein n=1 Tax=Aspergillus glaucus CBS 516.65 TaxID=1160497 RepID=A0A1L9V8M8_ASPGL|nr:hypothetical protein ASPGLDRAFT_51809 [Aspergillus glaucus CBS 516.65]OJJ80225.1 hypothetical protein ASPGLDRAFT_51809 [Aspergillus glaucus CBS 516.65]
MNQLRQLQSDRDQDREELRSVREELCGVREQNLTTIDFFIVRASTLDEWAEDRDPIWDDDRNDSVHGGRLRTDVKTALYYEPMEPERVSRWKSLFNHYYGMPFSSIVEIIGTLPDTVVEVMNRRASVQRMKVWQKGYNQGRRSTILRLADKYIQRFSEQGTSGLADESVKCDFRMLENTWERGWWAAAQEKQGS